LGHDAINDVIASVFGQKLMPSADKDVGQTKED
jgi:hypothetical protein